MTHFRLPVTTVRRDAIHTVGDVGVEKSLHPPEEGGSADAAVAMMLLRLATRESERGAAGKMQLRLLPSGPT